MNAYRPTAFSGQCNIWGYSVVLHGWGSAHCLLGTTQYLRTFCSAPWMRIGLLSTQDNAKKCRDPILIRSNAFLHLRTLHCFPSTPECEFTHAETFTFLEGSIYVIWNMKNCKQRGLCGVCRFTWTQSSRMTKYLQAVLGRIFILSLHMVRLAKQETNSYSIHWSVLCVISTSTDSLGHVCDIRVSSTFRTVTMFVIRRTQYLCHMFTSIKFHVRSSNTSLAASIKLKPE